MASGQQEHVMQINFIYDQSVSAAPAGFITDLNLVAQAAALYFTDPITVNIEVGWGEYGGVPMPSGELGITDLNQLAANAKQLTYDQVKTELMQHATTIYDKIAINNLPSTDPTGGGPFYISAAQQKAWGLLPANGTETDGVIGFSSTEPWDFNPSEQRQELTIF
jgi:hypothetical protein